MRDKSGTLADVLFVFFRSWLRVVQICLTDSVLPLLQVRLEWPTDLAVSPMDNSLYVLDNNVVLQISENHQVSTKP